MFQRKVPKSQEIDKNNYTLYEFHSTKERNWTENYYQIVSIDPAIVNLAIRIEKRYTNRIETIFMDKINVTSENPYDKISRTFFEIIDLLKKSHIIIIERQLHINYRAVRISQHIISFFMEHLRDTPLLPFIIEIDPKMKTKLLNAPRGLNAKEVKNWSVEKAMELLKMRNDTLGLSLINKLKGKKDDLADTIIQIEAMCILLELPLTK